MGNRTHVVITREGWYYVAMLGFIVAGAIIRDINLLYIMAGMMLGPLVLSLVIALQSLHRLRFQRRIPSLVSVGDRLIVELLAAKVGKGPASFAIVVQDSVLRESDERRVARAETRLLFSHIGGAKQVEATYQVRLHRRGRYRLGPLKVSCSMPLGLIRASTTRHEVDHVLVSPRVGQLLPGWSRRLRLSKQGGQKSMRRRGKTEGDFYAMRDWQTGDSLAWIHWRTSAKRDKLSVRQFEQRISQDLAIVLDLWQAAPTPLPPREVERAVSFVATLVVEHGRFGSTHLMVAGASRSNFILRGTSSPVFRRELMEKLAVVEATQQDRLPQVLAEVLAKVSPNAKMVIVSTRQLDLQDTERFAAIWSRTNLRRMLSDIVCVNVSAEDITDWFREDHEPATPPSLKPARPRREAETA